MTELSIRSGNFSSGVQSLEPNQPSAQSADTQSPAGKVSLDAQRTTPDFSAEALPQMRPANGSSQTQTFLATSGLAQPSTRDFTQEANDIAGKQLPVGKRLAQLSHLRDEAISQQQPELAQVVDMRALEMLKEPITQALCSIDRLTPQMKTAFKDTVDLVTENIISRDSDKSLQTSNLELGGLRETLRKENALSPEADKALAYLQVMVENKQGMLWRIQQATTQLNTFSDQGADFNTLNTMLDDLTNQISSDGPDCPPGAHIFLENLKNKADALKQQLLDASTANHQQLENKILATRPTSTRITTQAANVSEIFSDTQKFKLSPETTEFLTGLKDTIMEGAKELLEDSGLMEELDGLATDAQNWLQQQVDTIKNGGEPNAENTGETVDADTFEERMDAIVDKLKGIFNPSEEAADETQEADADSEVQNAEETEDAEETEEAEETDEAQEADENDQAQTDDTIKRPTAQQLRHNDLNALKLQAESIKTELDNISKQLLEPHKADLQNQLAQLNKEITQDANNRELIFRSHIEERFQRPGISFDSVHKELTAHIDQLSTNSFLLDEQKAEHIQALKDLDTRFLLQSFSKQIDSTMTSEIGAPSMEDVRNHIMADTRLADEQRQAVLGNLQNQSKEMLTSYTNQVSAMTEGLSGKSYDDLRNLDLNAFNDADKHMLNDDFDAFASTYGAFLTTLNDRLFETCCDANKLVLHSQTASLEDGEMQLTEKQGNGLKTLLAQSGYHPSTITAVKSGAITRQMLETLADTLPADGQPSKTFSPETVDSLNQLLVTYPELNDTILALKIQGSQDPQATQDQHTSFMMRRNLLLDARKSLSAQNLQALGIKDTDTVISQDSLEAMLKAMDSSNKDWQQKRLGHALKDINLQVLSAAWATCKAQKQSFKDFQASLPENLKSIQNLEKALDNGLRNQGQLTSVTRTISRISRNMGKNKAMPSLIKRLVMSNDRYAADHALTVMVRQLLNGGTLTGTMGMEGKASAVTNALNQELVQEASGLRRFLNLVEAIKTHGTDMTADQWKTQMSSWQQQLQNWGLQDVQDVNAALNNLDEQMTELRLGEETFLHNHVGVHMLDTLMAARPDDAATLATILTNSEADIQVDGATLSMGVLALEDILSHDDWDLQTKQEAMRGLSFQKDIDLGTMIGKTPLGPATSPDYQNLTEHINAFLNATDETAAQEKAQQLMDLLQAKNSIETAKAVLFFKNFKVGFFTGKPDTFEGKFKDAITSQAGKTFQTELDNQKKAAITVQQQLISTIADKIKLQQVTVNPENDAIMLDSLKKFRPEFADKSPRQLGKDLKEIEGTQLSMTMLALNQILLDDTLSPLTKRMAVSMLQFQNCIDVDRMQGSATGVSQDHDFKALLETFIQASGNDYQQAENDLKDFMVQHDIKNKAQVILFYRNLKDDNTSTGFTAKFKTILSAEAKQGLQQTEKLQLGNTLGQVYDKVKAKLDQTPRTPENDNANLDALNGFRKLNLTSAPAPKDMHGASIAIAMLALNEILDDKTLSWNAKQEAMQQLQFQPRLNLTTLDGTKNLFTRQHDFGFLKNFEQALTANEQDFQSLSQNLQNIMTQQRVVAKAQTVLYFELPRDNQGESVLQDKFTSVLQSDAKKLLTDTLSNQHQNPVLSVFKDLSGRLESQAGLGYRQRSSMAAIQAERNVLLQEQRTQLQSLTDNFSYNVQDTIGKAINIAMAHAFLENDKSMAELLDERTSFSGSSRENWDFYQSIMHTLTTEKFQLPADVVKPFVIQALNDMTGQTFVSLDAEESKASPTHAEKLCAQQIRDSAEIAQIVKLGESEQLAQDVLGQIKDGGKTLAFNMDKAAGVSVPVFQDANTSVKVGIDVANSKGMSIWRDQEDHLYHMTLMNATEAGASVSLSADVMIAKLSAEARASFSTASGCDLTFQSETACKAFISRLIAGQASDADLELCDTISPVAGHTIGGGINLKANIENPVTSVLMLTDTIGEDGVPSEDTALSAGLSLAGSMGWETKQTKDYVESTKTKQGSFNLTVGLHKLEEEEEETPMEPQTAQDKIKAGIQAAKETFTTETDQTSAPSDANQDEPIAFLGINMAYEEINKVRQSPSGTLLGASSTRAFNLNSADEAQAVMSMLKVSDACSNDVMKALENLNRPFRLEIVRELPKAVLQDVQTNPKQPYADKYKTTTVRLTYEDASVFVKKGINTSVLRLTSKTSGNMLRERIFKSTDLQTNLKASN